MTCAPTRCAFSITARASVMHALRNSTQRQRHQQRPLVDRVEEPLRVEPDRIGRRHVDDLGAVAAEALEQIMVRRELQVAHHDLAAAARRSVKQEPMIPCATVTFWCIEIVSWRDAEDRREQIAGLAPDLPPAFVPRAHAAARSTRRRTPAGTCGSRRGIAPSEWLTRYVQVSTIGNSRRQCSVSACDAARRVNSATPNSQRPVNSHSEISTPR